MGEDLPHGFGGEHLNTPRKHCQHAGQAGAIRASVQTIRPSLWNHASIKRLAGLYLCLSARGFDGARPGGN